MSFTLFGSFGDLSPGLLSFGSSATGFGCLSPGANGESDSGLLGSEGVFAFGFGPDLVNGLSSVGLSVGSDLSFGDFEVGSVGESESLGNFGSEGSLGDFDFGSEGSLGDFDFGSEGSVGDLELGSVGDLDLGSSEPSNGLSDGPSPSPGNFSDFDGSKRKSDL